MASDACGYFVRSSGFCHYHNISCSKVAPEDCPALKDLMELKP